MYRINPKPWADRTTPTNLTKNYDMHQWAHLKGSTVLAQPKRPYTDSLSSDHKGKEGFEHSPVPKARTRQEVQIVYHPFHKPSNPTYRSANFPKQDAQPQRTSNSQSFRTDKSMKTDYSLQEIPLLTKESTLPYYEPTKCSSNRNGIIKAYAANTNQGIVREYNEDRVSIILNIVKPQSRSNETWPKCSFFGVYDGHGGAACADFLRDNLHQYVIREPDFPWNPYEALRKGFEAAEKAFIELALQSYAKGHAERSGSCAIVSLIVGDTCYIANVGDSRAVMSSQKGKQVYTLSRDHKPCDELEQQRIQAGGGKIYQTQACTGPEEDQQVILGPLRVLPGRLSVSRTFGDIEAKLEQFGGNPKVVVAEPEIRSFKIQPEHDFLVLASDGIFDKMSSGDVLRTIWDDLHTTPQSQAGNLHAQVSGAVEAVLKESINRRTYDNITVVMVAFSREEDPRPKTVGSIEREQPSSVSPTPVQQKVPSHLYHHGMSHRDDKTYLRSSAQQAKALISYNKPMRNSLESIEYNKKAQAPQAPQQQQMFSFMKHQDVTNKYPDENQENFAYAANKHKELKQSSHHMEMKLSNDFRKLNQLKRAMPIQMHDFGSRYQGRIF